MNLFAEKLKELTGQAYWTLNGDDNSILEALDTGIMDIYLFVY